MPAYSNLNNSHTDGAYDADDERRASVELMEARFRDMVESAAREYDVPLSAEEIAALPRLGPIARQVVQDADVMFVEDDNGELVARYPTRSCAEDAMSVTATDGDDDEDQPPAYAAADTRYALVVPDIIQDDLRAPVTQPGAVARPIYIPPALRDVKDAPALVAKDPLTMNERLSAFDYAIRNPTRTRSLMAKLNDEALKALDAVLDYFSPRVADEFHVDPIAVVHAARPRHCGIDYDVIFCNGSKARVRDVDAWRAANGRVMLSLFWGNPKRVIAPSMINKLLITPQYKAEDGYFLRRMKADIERGFRRRFKDTPVVL